MHDQTAELEWRANGVPVSTRFDDPYFSLENGLEETKHVFLAGNDLPARFTPGFRIGELGFGTGLNLLAAWQAWLDSGTEGQLHFTSFEAFPMSAEEMERGLAGFPVSDKLVKPLLDAVDKGLEYFETGSVNVRLVIGDARETLPVFEGLCDAWFLDGFSPAKNPELWEAPLMQAVYDHTAQGGTVATYTAAGAVRKALSDAGFKVERIPGYGRKRHMTIARKQSA